MEKIFHNLHRYFPGGWRLAVLDRLKGRWIVKPAVAAIAYLKAENGRGRHILIQPNEQSHYLLADDLSWELILLHHRRQGGMWKPGRMVVETSPRNFQVWVHSIRPLTLLEKGFWLKKFRSDPGTHPKNRWGRCPGFRNCKEKYRNENSNYPLSRLIRIDWRRKASIPKIIHEEPESMTRSLSLDPQGSASRTLHLAAQGNTSPPTPRGAVCHPHRAIHRSDYDRGNESATDFSYALALLRRGYTDDQVRHRILAERRQWLNHRGRRRINDYLQRTIRRARAIVESS